MIRDGDRGQELPQEILVIPFPGDPGALIPELVSTQKQLEVKPGGWIFPHSLPDNFVGEIHFWNKSGTGIRRDVVLSGLLESVNTFVEGVTQVEVNLNERIEGRLSVEQKNALIPWVRAVALFELVKVLDVYSQVEVQYAIRSLVSKLLGSGDPNITIIQALISVGVSKQTPAER